MQDLNTKNDGIKRDTKRIKDNGEVFTPKTIIDQMLAKIPEENWKDPSKTFLEPTFGSGNIVIAILEKRIKSGIKPLVALKTLYGVELMQDNVNKCKQRIIDLLQENNVKITNNVINIINYNFVCSDFFNWDFENWRSKVTASKTETDFNGLDDLFY